MATTTNDNQFNKNIQNLSEDHTPIRRTSGRKKAGKGSRGGEHKIKKEPQRGMGVEKLERLRIQEKLKHQMSTHQINNNNPFAAPSFQFPNPGQNPGHFGQMGQGHFHGFDQFHTTYNDQLMISSTPNAQNCNTCHKKKRVLGENMQMGPIGECGFLGLDNKNIIINQKNQLFATMVPQVRYALPTSHPGHVEIVAVHRKGSSSNKGSGVVMEYEFFPNGGRKKEKEESFNNDHDLVMMKNLTCSTTTSSAEPSFDASTCIDLSLKLSY